MTKLDYFKKSFPDLKWIRGKLNLPNGGQTFQYVGMTHSNDFAIGVCFDGSKYQCFIDYFIAQAILKTCTVDDKIKLILTNVLIPVRFTPNIESLKKISALAERALKRDYILTKKEEIYAESN